MTYKILYNDAVAMTGGQHDRRAARPAGDRRARSPPKARQRIVVVTDEPEELPRRPATGRPASRSDHRDELDAVQRELRENDGRARRSSTTRPAPPRSAAAASAATFPDPAKRVVINELVCEGCGDCSVQSNCLSVEPLETEFGSKRTINQSACNKDYSCLKGFCPSFVTVEGGEPEERQGSDAATAKPNSRRSPNPRPRDLDQPLRHRWSPASAAWA